jgi:iron-sulfur cluster assembly accessory protein
VAHAHTHTATETPAAATGELVILTPTAQAKAKAFIAEEDEQADKVLRVGVTSGGCSGFSYSVSIDVQKDGDHVQRYEGLSMVVDPVSLRFLSGATVDYVDELGQAGFKFTNPKATSSCGCGSSFSV